MQIRALMEQERKYTYTQGSQLLGQTGCIGHLRGDFGRNGTGFFTSWNDHCGIYKTEEFKKELDNVINTLRFEKGGLLENRFSMVNYASRCPESVFDGNYCSEYGFRVDSGSHSFLLRCNANQGDYNFYCYCYVSEWLDKHIKNAEKGIRFIDEHYGELFKIADGEKIVITDDRGKKEERVCRFIDEYHTEIGGQLYHICQFAELMKRNGSTYEPKEKKELQKAEDKLVYHSEFSGEKEVKLDIQTYQNNGRIYIGLLCKEDGCFEPFANVTVNIDAPTPDFGGYLDTNHLSNVEKFISENGLGTFTGFMGQSGYCSYPLYQFHVDRLRELCPEQMAAYEQGMSRNGKREKKAKSR